MINAKDSKGPTPVTETPDSLSAEQKQSKPRNTRKPRTAEKTADNTDGTAVTKATSKTTSKSTPKANTDLGGEAQAKPSQRGRTTSKSVDKPKSPARPKGSAVSKSSEKSAELMVEVSKVAPNSVKAEPTKAEDRQPQGASLPTQEAGAKNSPRPQNSRGRKPAPKSAVNQVQSELAVADKSVESARTEAKVESPAEQGSGVDKIANKATEAAKAKRGRNTRGRRPKPAGANIAQAAEAVKDTLEDFSVQGVLSSPVWDEVSAPDLASQETEADSASFADGEQASPTEKKKRGRSRGGRGRKKNVAKPMPTGEAATGADLQAELLAQGDESSLQEESVKQPQNLKNKDAEAREAAKEKLAAQNKLVRRKMFVSIVPEEQVEVVITEEGAVQEYYVEMVHQLKTKGNIYKGTIHNVDPNLQAAFVSYGAVKNGFLQIDEVHPEYYAVPHDGGRGKKYPPIQKVLKAGQEVLVQVVKEPAGTKGAFLTTYLSMPGRFLVLTPGREQIGVSRKVDNEAERARLRDLLEGLDPGAGLGVIVRTVSMGTSKTNLQADLEYLKKNWAEVRTKGTTLNAPCLVYQELDLATRAVRDYLNDAVSEIWIDDEAASDSISEMVTMLFPQKTNLVRLYNEGQPLFERYNLQRQIDQIHSREVSLPSGGRLVIDPTEALTAIDINSGRSGGKNNFEDMAYRTNMEAARMIPLHLRLRDIGGQVVIDFIEMRDKSHWREVEKTLRDSMKIDRARHDIGKISSFGLLEIVRQRLGSSAISISTEPCPHCKGTGVRRNMEWQAQKALRDIAKAMRLAKEQESVTAVYETDANLAWSLLNSKRQRLWEMEQSFGVSLEIRPKAEQF